MNWEDRIRNDLTRVFFAAGAFGTKQASYVAGAAGAHPAAAVTVTVRFIDSQMVRNIDTGDMVMSDPEIHADPSVITALAAGDTFALEGAVAGVFDGGTWVAKEPGRYNVGTPGPVKVSVREAVT